MTIRIALIVLCALLAGHSWAADDIPNHTRHPLHSGQSSPAVIRLSTGKPLYAPTLAQGGLSSQNWLAGSSGTPLLDDIWHYADHSVQQEDIGTTVAGVDASGHVTAPLSANADLIGNWQTAASSVNPFNIGYDADMLGGVSARADGSYIPRSLLLTTDPYGPYSAGCGAGVSMIGPGSTPQYPVSEADPRGGATSVVASGQFDTVAHCTLVANAPARLILTATGYTATSVLLASPLTASQAAQIVPNEYITTNSPNSDLNLTAATGTLPPKNLYAGFVSARPNAGDTSISVYAWDVPGYGTGKAGQVPQTAALDTVWSAYSAPTVFIGGGASQAAFAQNWFFAVNGADLTPSASNRSLIHQLTPLEIDLNIGGTAPNNSIWWQGISMNAGNQPDALTKDSRQFYMGGNINHHLIIDGARGNWDIEANGFYVPVAHDGLATVSSAASGSGVTSQLSAVWEQWIEGANRMQMRLYDTTGNTSAPVGWQQAVVHLGPTVDGTPVQTGDMGGNPQGEIQWNEGGYYGGISLCGYAANCGLTIKGDGSSLFRKPASFSAAANFDQIDLSAASSSGTTVSGQGMVGIWNKVSNGRGATELVNVNPGVIGGFVLYDTPTGNAVAPGDQLIAISKSGGVVTALPLWLGGGEHFEAGSTVTFQSASNANALYAGLSDDGMTLNFGYQVSGGGNLAGINNLSAQSLTLGSGPIVIPDASSAPASSDACTAGTTEFVGNYMYRCISSGNWGRVAMTTGY